MIRLLPLLLMLSSIQVADAFVSIKLSFRSVYSLGNVLDEDTTAAISSSSLLLRERTRIPTSTNRVICDSLLPLYASSFQIIAEACSEPIILFTKIVTESYTTSLIQNPLPTKSLTAGFLCGISDIIAQAQQKSRRAVFDFDSTNDTNNPEVEAEAIVDSYPYNIYRTLRFASKGCLGGILWTFWYDWIDGFLMYADTNVNAISGISGITSDLTTQSTAAVVVTAGASIDEGSSAAVVDYATTTTTESLVSSSKISFYVLTGAILPVNVETTFLAFATEHIGAVTTVISIILEQFIWCPIVYGTFEIPISTLMNGGQFKSIRGEVDTKLDGLLVSNAKVWTLANLVIYNAPLEWRLFIGNCIDIFWQSIVSEMSADCGSGGDEEECIIPNDEGFEDDYNKDKIVINRVVATAATVVDINSSNSNSNNDNANPNTVVPDPTTFLVEKSRI
eukprot:CAMPEP_0171037028 /NCGR_PEP_ID=MMETSP0736-20130129/41984_1 /TAXON_ID=186038 /ORGANISM="Fragilariopsis kerguelensis, Strain L26-C5" /LENGTH=448 /DNA_ID=CAMNT_0011482377 /DNA_START=1 /DNA_END=1347 /DNA_ORIENTATION=+